MVGQTAWHCSSLLCQHHGFKRNSLLLQHYCQEVSTHPLSLLAHHLLFSLFFSSLINSHWLCFFLVYSHFNPHTRLTAVCSGFDGWDPDAAGGDWWATDVLLWGASREWWWWGCWGAAGPAVYSHCTGRKDGHHSNEGFGETAAAGGDLTNPHTFSSLSCACICYVCSLSLYFCWAHLRI